MTFASRTLALVILLATSTSVCVAQELTPEQRREVAHRIITMSAQVKPREVVVISGNVAFMPLMEDLALEASKAGGYAIFMPTSDRFMRGVLTEVPEEFYGQPDPIDAWLKNVDVLIGLPDLYDEKEVSRDVPQARFAKLYSDGEDRFRAAEQASKTRSLYIEAPVPGQAAIFGFDLNSFAAMQWQAIGADDLSIERSGKQLADLLAHAKMVHVTAPGGTDFTFKPGQRDALVSGGITHAEASNLDERNASLPGGYVVAPLAARSFQGKIFTPEDYCTGLQKLTNVSYHFEAGKMTSFTAEENEKCLRNYFAPYSGPKDVVASVQIGLNPYLKSQSKTAPFNTAGMFWVILGRDSRLGITDTQLYWGIPVFKATVDVDGRKIIDNGQLQSQ